MFLVPMFIPAPFTWKTTYGPITQTGDVSHGVARTITTALPASDINFSGSKFRITFRGPSSGSSSVNKIYAGHGNGGVDDFDGTQVPVTIGGSSGPFTFSANTDYLSDEMSYAVDETKEFLVSMYIGASAFGVYNSGSGRAYDEAGDTAATTNKSGSLSGLSKNNSIKQIEVLS